MHIKGNYSRGSMIFAAAVLLALVISSIPAYAQDESTITGTVVSATRNTMTIRTSNGMSQLFIFPGDGRRPSNITVGSQVRVVSTPGNEPGIRVASQVTPVQGAAAQQESNAVVPPEVRRLERDIERAVRRYQVGIRAGVALDPELILIGVQGQVGPFFRSGVFFRPNVEFGFGEVTAMFGLNPEVIYRLPVSAREDRWSSYVGAGLGINLIHQNFESEEGGRRIDFGDFHSDTALNILGGVRNRNGLFMELRTSVYSDPSPTLRLVFGFNF